MFIAAFILFYFANADRFNLRSPYTCMHRWNRSV